MASSASSPDGAGAVSIELGRSSALAIVPRWTGSGSRTTAGGGGSSSASGSSLVAGADSTMDGGCGDSFLVTVGSRGAHNAQTSSTSAGKISSSNGANQSHLASSLRSATALFRAILRARVQDNPTWPVNRRNASTFVLGLPRCLHPRHQTTRRTYLRWSGTPSRPPLRRGPRAGAGVIRGLDVPRVHAQPASSRTSPMRRHFCGMGTWTAIWRGCRLEAGSDSHTPTKQPRRKISSRFGSPSLDADQTR